MHITFYEDEDEQMMMICCWWNHRSSYRQAEQSARYRWYELAIRGATTANGKELGVTSQPHFLLFVSCLYAVYTSRLLVDRLRSCKQPRNSVNEWNKEINGEPELAHLYIVIKY